MITLELLPFVNIWFLLINPPYLFKLLVLFICRGFEYKPLCCATVCYVPLPPSHPPRAIISENLGWSLQRNCLAIRPGRGKPPGHINIDGGSNYSVGYFYMLAAETYIIYWWFFVHYFTFGEEILFWFERIWYLVRPTESLTDISCQETEVEKRLLSHLTGRCSCRHLPPLMWSLQSFQHLLPPPTKGEGSFVFTPACYLAIIQVRFSQLCR